MYEIRKIERICLGGMILCGISTVWNPLKILWDFVFFRIRWIARFGIFSMIRRPC